MLAITNLTEIKAREIAQTLNSLEPKQLWGHCTSTIDEWYTTEQPKHSPGDGNWWTADKRGASAKVEKYDSAWSVVFNEWFKSEADALITT